MNGVEILASSEVVVEANFNWTNFVGFFVGIVLVASMFGILLSLYCKDWSILVACMFVGVLCGAMFGMVVGVATEIPVTYAIQHKVVISDEVQVNDFLEKYEIVNQEGKIYTVREILTEQND
jgi:Na+/citrate or Na+/malate symporter